MCVEAECCIKTVGAWEKKTKQKKHTHAQWSTPTSALHVLGRWKKRQILCVCGCFKWLWLSWKLSLTILSPSTCEEWISAEWQITVCLPYCPHHMRHGCVTHLTPVIIAFRPVTGRISIHSGWDLFFGGVGWLVVEVGVLQQNWWHLFGPKRK